MAEEQDPRACAALAYELAALTELRHKDVAGARSLYQRACEYDPSFRPPLFALVRLLEDARDWDELARVLARTVRASRQPAERAAALVDLGCLFEDQLGDAAAAADSFERALAVEPGSVSAARMLERSLRGLGRAYAADAIVAQRAAHTYEPQLRAALAREAAQLLAARGHVTRAIETLASAIALPGRRFSSLRALAELASEHGQLATAARAFEDAAALLAAHGSGQDGPDADDIAGHLASRAAALPLAAQLYRRASQLYLAHERATARARDSRDSQTFAERESAQRMLERACASLPDELVLQMEHAEVCEDNGDLAGARTSLLALLDRADPQRAAALHFRLAELAEQSGEPREAAARLRSGLALDPESPVLQAVLDDVWLDLDALPALCDSLEERASTGPREERALDLLRAAIVAEYAGDAPRALRAYARCVELTGEKDAASRRELYGAAIRARDHASVRSSAQALSACDLTPAERSAVLRSAFDASLAQGEIAYALRALQGALDDPACDAWAGHSAWLMAGLRGDHELLAAAHRALAEQAGDRELAAAHVAAEARALLRSGQKERALERFRRVLELTPADAYAVASLEALLIERGEAAEAVHLLRATAAAEQDSQRSERALLHAGLAAQAAGRLDLAASSFEEAAAKSPDSIAPLWLQLRMAERARDDELATSTLRALAERERRLAQPGFALLELAEQCDADGEFERASTALEQVAGGERAAYEAAVSAVIAPRRHAQAAASQPDALRTRAFGQIAQSAGPQLRELLEHEQLAELAHEAPTDARTLLRARAEQSLPSASEALLAFLLSENGEERAATLARLSRLEPDPRPRAELALAAQRAQLGARLRAGGREPEGDSTLMAAIALYEEAPETPAAALALSEAVSERAAAELRITALNARLRHTPEENAGSIRGALARALLDADRPQEALALLRELLARDANDLSAWECLRLAARRSGSPTDQVSACDELARHTTGAAQADLLEEAAQVLHDTLQKPAPAETRLRAALAADPTRASAFEHLHDLLLGQGDLAGLQRLLQDRVAVCPSADERADLMLAQARILSALGHNQDALAKLQAIVAIDAQHPAALGLAAEIHAAAQDFRAAVTALSALARTHIPQAQRRIAHESAADLLEHKLKDLRGAHAELAQLVSAGLGDLAVFTRMADLATRAGLAEEAVQALSGAAALSDGKRRAAFERRAATLYAKALGKSDAAREALRRALAADPLDVDALEALHACADPASPELTSSEMLLHELWSGLRAEPADPRLLRTLSRVGRLRGDAALEHIAISTLCALDLARDEERAALAETRARLPVLPSGAISETQFALLGGPTHAHAAFRVARLVSRAAAARDAEVPPIGRRSRVREETEPFRSVARLVRCFGLELAELHQGVAPGQPPRVWARSSGALMCALPHAATEPLSAKSRFWIGAQCAGVRLGVAALVHGDRGAARDLLLAAVCLRGVGPMPVDAERLRPLAAQLARGLSRKERRELEAALAELPNPLTTLQEVADDARAGAFRAGMLLAVDVAPALSHVFGEPLSVETVTNSKLGLRLLRFWTSQTCHALLRGLGMTA